MVPMGTPAPNPPELVSKLPFDQFPFCTFPKPPHTPDLGVGGFYWAAPTAADPESGAPPRMPCEVLKARGFTV